MKNIKHYFKGFTLVELIIVITILAIISTIAFISFQNYFGNARDSNRVSTIKNIETGLELFTLKTSQFPTPDNPKIYTGGLEGKSQLNQGIIGENVAKIIFLSNIPLDPKDKTNYVYSTFGNSNKYYQIGINIENSQLSFIPQTYANSKTSIVKGNYKFDPSFPSLIMVENEALINSGIFSPDVCFVMNKGKNTLDECNEIKSEMILKDYDNSLVGYWDMETLTGNLLKDLSGNNNHGTFSGGMIYENSLISGILGKGLHFTGGFISIGDTSTLRLKDEITMIVNFKMDYIDYSIGNLSLVGKYGASLPNDLWYNMNVNHYFGNGVGYINCGGLCGTSVLDYPLLDLNYYNISMTNSPKSRKTFINGFKKGELKGGSDFNASESSTVDFRIGSVVRGWTNFKGVIDEVKIYNRALSPEEILGQAKIAGF